MENENLNESADSITENQSGEQKLTQVDIIVAQVKVETIIQLLNNVNWVAVDKMIEMTPGEMKDTLSYKILFESREFFQKIDSIYLEEELVQE